MSEGDKEKDTDRVEPLEAKPGGKEKGTTPLKAAKEVNEDKK